MAQPERGDWLLAYDIADKRRLTRFGKTAGKELWRLQWSLYRGPLNQAERTALEEMLAEMIDPAEDRVTLYRIDPRREILHAGRPAQPEGLMLFEHD